MKQRASESRKKPARSGATPSASFKSERRNSSNPEEGSGLRPYSARYCDRVSRRPGDSASSITLAGVSERNAFRRCRGSAARRSTASSGRGRARREQADLRDLVERALGVRVERADRFDLRIEEVEPVGERAAHGEKIDESAAHAVLARRDHLRDVAVAGERELGAQRIEVERFSCFQKEAVPGEERRRTQAREGGRSGNDGDVEILAHDAVKGREALRHQVVVRREMIVGQGLPVGQEQHRKLRREPRDLVLQPLRLGRLGAENHGRTRASRETRERQRVARAVQAGGARVLLRFGKDNCAHRSSDRNSKTRVEPRLDSRSHGWNSGPGYNYIVSNSSNPTLIQ